MAELFDTIVEYFERDEWEFRRIGTHNAIEMMVAGDHGTFRLIVIVDADRSIVRFMTFVEGRVPEGRRREVMECLTRANYGMLLGNFEMDLGDGEVRFKTAIDAEGGEVTHAQFQSLLATSVFTMDRYYQGLQWVIQGAADPAAAVEEAEQ